MFTILILVWNDLPYLKNLGLSLFSGDCQCDEKKNNKNYPLPHRCNIVYQEIERIATTITIIDADVSDCFNSINKINSSVQNFMKIFDTELKIKCCN